MSFRFDYEKMIEKNDCQFLSKFIVIHFELVNILNVWNGETEMALVLLVQSIVGQLRFVIK